MSDHSAEAHKIIHRRVSFANPGGLMPRPCIDPADTTRVQIKMLMSQGLAGVENL